MKELTLSESKQVAGGLLPTMNPLRRPWQKKGLFLPIVTPALPAL